MEQVPVSKNVEFIISNDVENMFLFNQLPLIIDCNEKDNVLWLDIIKDRERHFTYAKNTEFRIWVDLSTIRKMFCRFGQSGYDKYIEVVARMMKH